MEKKKIKRKAKSSFVSHSSQVLTRYLMFKAYTQKMVKNIVNLEIVESVSFLPLNLWLGLNLKIRSMILYINFNILLI